MLRAAFGLVLLLSAQVTAPAQPAARANCEAENASLNDVARQAKIAINVPSSVRVGESIEVKWQFGAERPQVALFLVLAMPDTARFAGTFNRFKVWNELLKEDEEKIEGPYFIALPGNVPGPAGLEFRKARLRVFVPLHNAKTKPNGSIWVKPLRAGNFDLEPALVAKSLCGERVIATAERREFVVGLGKPELVVQDTVVVASTRPSGAQAKGQTARGAQSADPAPKPQAQQTASGQPDRIVTSNSREYVLHQYTERYVVLDNATGAKLVDRPGFAANFSPTSRFLAAKVGGRLDTNATMEIVDLLAGRMIGAVTGPILGWSHGDAVLYAGGVELQAFHLVAPLVDDHEEPERTYLHDLDTSGAGRDADSWNTVPLYVSVKRGIVMLANNLSYVTFDLYSGTETRFGENEDQAFRAFIEREYGLRNFRFPNRWWADAKIGLSHTCSYCDGKDARDNIDVTPDKLVEKGKARPYQKEFVVAHASTPSRPGAKPAATMASRASWATSRAGADTVAAERDFIARLGEFGIVFDRHAIVMAPPPAKSPDDTGDDLLFPYAGQWAAGLREKLKSTFGDKFEDFDDLAALIGHWQIPRGNRIVHIIQHGRMPAFGWESFAMQIITFEERNGRFSNLRLEEELMGPETPEGHTRGVLWKHWGEGKVKLRVVTAGENLVLIGSPAFDRVGVFNLDTSEMKIITDTRNSELMSDLALTSDRRKVMQINQDGQFFVYDLASGRHLVSGRDIDNEIIIYDANGYYAATYEGAYFMHVRFPGEAGLHSFQQFSATLDRPDIIKAALQDPPRASSPPALTPPPTVTIELAGTAQKPMLKIAARANGALKALRIYQDGHLTDDIAVAGRDLSNTVPVNRLKNARWITAVAVDDKGFFSQPAAVQLAGAGTLGGALLGVAVGVDLYNSPTLPRLRFATADANDIVKAVEGNTGRYYGRVAVTRMTDAGVQPAKIVEALERAVEEAQPGDTVMFFFAGHGVRGKDGALYLATTNSDPANFARTSLAWTTVAAVLQKSKARVIVLLDACHSGLAGQETAASNDAAVAQMMAGSRAPMLVFAAAKGRQFSQEQSALGNGVFTRAFKQALGPDRRRSDLNGNGVIEISELYRAVKGSVIDLTAGAQTPWLARTDLIGDFVLF